MNQICLYRRTMQSMIPLPNLFYYN